ncbi:MAG: SGNH/GDSL hydrolase family protein [Okeania sp. SIO2H7]|nr:SGNH/GDSL hydrolase family protein [Okeania sp. SIO2H7]
MKFVLAILAIILGLLALAEVGLRVFLGFGNPLIYIADEEIGYLLAPNQRVRRFGNFIEINRYSMRSSSITSLPSESNWRVLLLGDSVANGGWWTDQTETISQQIPREWDNSSLEVLNASANSWGPRNELAYLKKYGLFGARAVILLINTDDLFAKAPSSLVVGSDRNYPNSKPAGAIAEFLSRYLLPSPKLSAEKPKEKDVVAANLEAIGEIQKIVEAANAKFILAMTPLLREVGEPGSRDYELKTRQRLTEFKEKEAIIYVDFLPIFQSHSNPDVLYRDHIHLSREGNLEVSKTLTNYLKKTIGELEF